MIANFKLDRNSHESLSTQLARQIKEYINGCSNGDKFPSERKLADDLGINRVTIQAAMDEFVNSGVLVRCGNKGTFVYPHKETPQKLHPLQLEGLTFDEARPMPLRVMLYEDYGFQRDFWCKVATLFNQKYPLIPVDIIWVPHEYSGANYANYIEEMHPDVIQTYYHPMRSEMLAKLPASFMNKINADDFCLEHIQNYKESLFDAIVPVYYSPSWQYMNVDLAKKHGIDDLIAIFNRGGFGEVIGDVIRRAPELIGIDTIWYYLSCRPFDAGCCNDGYSTYFNDFFDFVDSYDWSGVNPLYCDNSKDYFNAFAEQKRLFCFSSYVCLISLLDNYLPFEIAMSLPRFAKGHKRHSGTSCLGISKNSSRSIAGQIFLEFVLSAEVQKNIPTELKSFAFRREANDEFIKMGLFEKDHLANVLDGTVSFYHFKNLVLQPMQATPQSLFDYVAKKCTRQQAYEIAQMHYLNYYESQLQDFNLNNWYKIYCKQMGVKV